ncbi:MAG: hypothetical protein UU67_C0040G0001 [Candidatus Daviesbacteria bacterium GW2011_GWB1_41_5]|uniref:Uncharacterized protein n=1 Tax=Candidatus Daviesbacteria bacterium GW2011_GWB1_41_5 TaxID=1618429 RepID=A0A0G0WL57_9BACT|nr:MAG: hypothetical protein UU67_C0040G0001 [Candidatus Daviesbacteria bacterium GW2011_GWB1_41_5]
MGARRAQVPPAPDEPFLCLEKEIFLDLFSQIWHMFMWVSLTFPGKFRNP